MSDVSLIGLLLPSQLIKLEFQSYNCIMPLSHLPSTLPAGLLELKFYSRKNYFRSGFADSNWHKHHWPNECRINFIQTSFDDNDDED